MGRERDPKRDKAREIYIASGGNIILNVIAAQLGVGDGTLRGWKAKDKWDKLPEEDMPEAVESKPKIKKVKASVAEITSTDELYQQAIQIVRQANQASVSLLQRKLRIGNTRATRLIDDMERNGIVGKADGSRPRQILSAKSPDKTEKKRNATNEIEWNAPFKPLERSINIERSAKEQSAYESEEEIESEIEDEDGLTPKRRLFVKYYLINFNATQAAIKAGYSARSARDIGYELLTKPDIKQAIRKYTDEITLEIGVNAQRILMEHLKIAFADVTDYVSFGQQEVPIMTMFGPMKDEEGNIQTKMVNYVSFKESGEVDGTLISEVKQGKDGASIKLHDKTKSLDVLSKYIDLLPDQHRRMVENEKLRIAQERLELDKAKAAGEGDLDEELIDDWVGGVLGDEDKNDSGEEGTE